MKDLPFDKPGRFYRGNLHMHSTCSDGKLPVADAIAAYRDHGYDFVALTDHFLEQYRWPITDTREYRTDTFTTIIGAELHAPRLENGERWHIVAAGLPLDFAPCAQTETGVQLAMRAREAGAFVGMAHPFWYGQTLEDALSCEAAHAVEIYNHGCQVEVDRGDGWYMNDLLAQRGRRLTAFATDDSHFKVVDYRGGWTMVKAERLDPDALLAALKAGHFYASTGPELKDVRLEGGRIHVACSPVRSIIVTGPGAKSERINSASDLTEASFPLQKFGNAYCRVTVVDEAGKRAWTNPIWLD